MRRAGKGCTGAAILLSVGVGLGWLVGLTTCDDWWCYDPIGYAIFGAILGGVAGAIIGVSFDEESGPVAITLGCVTLAATVIAVLIVLARTLSSLR